MKELYTCKRCGMAGARKFIPYKIIRDDNGESIKFMGQICERCFDEFFGRAPTTENENEKQEES